MRRHFEWGPVVAVCVLGVVGTGFAYWIMGSLIARVGGTRASFITFVIPVVALFLGVTFRGDDVAVLCDRRVRLRHRRRACWPGAGARPCGHDGSAAPEPAPAESH